MDLTGSNFIGGDRSAGGAVTFTAVDPATGEALPPAFHEAEPGEIDRALEAAEAAFEADRQRPAEERAGLLERIAEEIERLGDAIVERAGLETALGEARLRGERGRTTGQLRLFASVVREGSWVEARIDPALPERQPAPRPDLRRMLVPLGPVVVFGASNFPLAFSTAGGDTASALAAGCPVVVKAHPAHPGTAELVAAAVRAAVERAGFHPGTFSLLHGARPETSLALVRHPLTRAVGFTGSLRAGRALFDAAAARPEPIPVYAEMGSINPVFLLPGALEARADEIAGGLAGSVCLGAGQFCTNPGLVVGLAGERLDAFVTRLAAQVGGMPGFTLLTRSIRDAYREGVAALAATPGVEALARVEAEPSGDGAATAGAAVFRTDARTFLAERRLGQELFGPSTLVVACASEEEMLGVARALEGSLTATIHADDADLARSGPLLRLLARKAGRLLFGGFPTGVEVGHAMHHGGPYPAATDVRSTSVGSAAIGRFARPICFQSFPDAALPPELRDANPRGIWRLVDGAWSNGSR